MMQEAEARRELARHYNAVLRNLSDPDIDQESDGNNGSYYEEYLELDEEVKNPVPEELLASLPTNKFTEANKKNFSDENKMCTICQMNYEVDDEYIIVPCLHRFHSSCCKQWFAMKDTCPICKQKVSAGNEGSGVHNHHQHYHGEGRSGMFGDDNNSQGDSNNHDDFFEDHFPEPPLRFG